MKKNSQHTIKIETATAKGFGMGYIEGMVIFVDGGLPGDELLIHILKAKTRYAYGKILKIISPSPHRIKSPCPVSEKCGGCQWQHCEYSAQLGFKKQIVIDALERIGGVKNPPVKDIIGMENPARYRNKAVFPVVPHDNKDGFAIGMFAPRSHRMIELSDCNIQHTAHVNVLTVVKEHMRKFKISAYDETAHKGLMRFITIRTSLYTSEVMAVLTINGKTIPAEAELINKLEKINVNTAVISIHETRGNTVLGEQFRTLFGSGFITECLNGSIKYQLSAPSFFQVNPTQATKLYAAALSQAGFDDSIRPETTRTQTTVIDAHCGVGGVTLLAAQYAEKVIGVDIVDAAITDAQKNAAINGITNAQFIHGTAEKIIPEILEASSNENEIIVFLDPPRKGCEPELLETLINSGIKKIIYISCDPATLSRDIKKLTEGGFNIITAQPVDLFPHTCKVETSVLLTRE